MYRLTHTPFHCELLGRIDLSTVHDIFSGYVLLLTIVVN